MHDERGMTLVETLVALAILAGVVLSAYAMTAQSARFAASEQERLLAGIIADNQAIEILLHEAPPDAGEDATEVEFGGRKWTARKTVTEANDDLLRIVIAISRAGEERVLARVETLRGPAP